LILFVPHSTNVSIRSTVGRVSVTGSLAGVFVETESGAVTLQLPEAPDIDISLRTLEGSIESSVPLDIFGKRNVRALDARIGSGGSTAIVRTRSGNIKLAANATKPPDAISAKAEDPQRHASGPQQAHNALRPASAARTLEGEAGIRTGDEVIRLEARLVNVLVKVTDAGGKALPALTRDDFLVYEDDARQDISYFEPVTAPLHIVLLLDLSGSTEKKMKIMKRAAQKFVDSLKPADTIAVAAFTRRFFVISNFTKDHKLLKDRIGDIKNRHAGTAFYDAMWATLDLLDEARAGRRAIVVLTDGVDNSLDHPDDQELAARHDFDELLSRVEEADATIYPIYLDTEYETIGRGGRGGHDAYVTARKQLQALADQTGSVMFKAERAEDLEAAYGQVAAELHSLYSLAYAPKKLIRDGKWRRIRVEVNLSGAKLRAKRGYYAR
jgi:Ca-activated chloride channel family protein